jgi:hypothetical protein
MSCAFFLDTVRLRAHISMIEEEKRLAERLCREIERIKTLADDNYALRMNQLLMECEGLVRFFSETARVMDETTINAELTIREVERMMIDNRFRVESVIALEADY